MNELRYSLRSLTEFAPWINHIWLVTADQVPGWLDTDNDRISVVTHEQIWAGEQGCPRSTRRRSRPTCTGSRG